MGTVRSVVFDFWRAAGVTTVFGNPGSTELRMLRDWPPGFRYVLALQESIAVGAAAGFALGTGRPGIVSLHSAGGVGHGLGAVFNAYRDRVPLLVLAGQQTRSMLPTRPFLAADDPALFPQPYVKVSSQPARAEDVPLAVAEAWYTALTPPCGPVFLSVPEDDWDAPADPLPQRTVWGAPAPAPGAVQALASALGAATRPVLIAGAGVDQEGAIPAVVALAERLAAPVWTTPLSGRCGFPEDHPLFAGFLPPVRDQLAGRLEGHDLVLSLGGPLFKYHVASTGPFLPPGAELFTLDCDPREAAWAPIGTAVVGSVAEGVRALLALLPGRPAPLPRPLRPPLAPAAPGDPIAPELAIDALRDAFPAGAVLVEEIPSHREVFHARFPVTSPGGFLTTGSGALGWGAPLAVGRALAGSRVVCVIGDGSLMYSVQALWTAARHRLPVTFVVLNNAGYEAVKQLANRLGSPQTVGTDLAAIDFVGVAAGLGVPGARVPDAAALPAVLADHIGREGPTLVEIPVSTVTGAAAYS